MEKINPLGRNGQMEPYACFCSGQVDGYALYNQGKGPNDSCANCGCYCDRIIGIQFNTESYRGIADMTDRQSTIPGD